MEIEQNLEKKTNFNINRCWNVIRAIFETQYYVENYCQPMEEALHPVLNFLENAEFIDFDDDCGQVVGLIIKFTKQVTQTCKVVFPLVPKIHAKYKGVFGNLIQAVNMYIKEGHAWLAEE